MSRIALGIEYDGTNYFGWQLQNHTDQTVQFQVEHALSNVADHRVDVVCAGRTDTAVHACEQVIHFDTTATRTMRSWVFGANSNLPKDVCVLWAAEVSDDFHARFSATARQYQYVIYQRNVRPTFLANRTTWDYRPLDVSLMQRAAEYLVGEHDFSSFRSYACQAKNPVRNVQFIRIRAQEQFIIIDIKANAFLHHMVRNISGVLMDVGAGDKPVEWAKEVLDHRDRVKGGVTALPHGLYLNHIDYPEHFGLPQLSEKAVVW